jgi:predicted N-acyltransferase
MTIRIHESIETVAATDWDRLVPDSDPFACHAFLDALERHGCLQPFGWHPRHVTLRDAAGRLLGAVPFYLKENSYGEFVFDWEWADAYRRAGLDYYPKGVVGIPYTPATGPRILLADPNDDTTADRLIAAIHALATELSLSSVHWNFLVERDATRLGRAGLLARSGCQYHWRRRDERTFDDLLAGFSSRKRKKIRQERRRAEASGLVFATLHGDEARAEDWDAFHALYLALFESKWGLPTLSRDFFAAIGQRLGNRVVLQFAHEPGARAAPLAMALFLRSDTTLYGRHWGSRAHVDGLHFELCYYRGLDYCLRHGLERFEPGAQGEYKIARGFLPTLTRSAHWIADARFHAVLADHLEHETTEIRRQAATLAEHSPYRRTGGA